MDRIALIYGERCIYWSSVIFVLAVLVTIFCFLAVYLRKEGNIAAAFAAVPLAVFLSFLFARMIHWYCYAESYRSFSAAMGNYGEGGFALIGAFAGCGLAVVVLTLVKIVRHPARMLDCLCLAGGIGIAIGRLASFFGASDRGQIMENIRWLPWACPVTNVVSGATEYRLATFLLQAIAVGSLTLTLTYLYATGKGRKWKDGEVTLVFLLCYCAAQVLLDSTRYDSMYFRSNGFVSVVQVCSAVVIVLIAVLFSVQLVRSRGFRKEYGLLWMVMAVLLGCAGYMEYYVQRHGNQAAMAYGIMGAALCVYVVLVLGTWTAGSRKNPGDGIVG